MSVISKITFGSEVTKGLENNIFLCLNGKLDTWTTRAGCQERNFFTIGCAINLILMYYVEGNMFTKGQEFITYIFFIVLFIYYIKHMFFLSNIKHTIIKNHMQLCEGILAM